MKRIIVSIYFCLSPAITFCQSQENKIDFNFGFEKINPTSKLPLGWYQVSRKDFGIKTDTTQKHSGKIFCRNAKKRLFWILGIGASFKNEQEAGFGGSECMIKEMIKENCSPLLWS